MNRFSPRIYLQEMRKMAKRTDCARFGWDDGYPICRSAGLCCDATENAEQCENFVPVGELEPPKVAIAGKDCPNCKEYHVTCVCPKGRYACYQFQPIEVKEPTEREIDVPDP